MNNHSPRKKVGIITILDVANFGSMLQAYALALTIEQLGFEVFFINYWRKAYRTSQKVRTFLADRSLGNLIRRTVYATSALLVYATLRRRLRRFVTHRFHFTRPYHDIKALRQSPPRADCYVSGSDQVWNSVHNGGYDPAFFLDFGHARRIAYAASSGIEAFPENELPTIIQQLKAFQALSVRESQTTSYFHQIGFPKCEHVLDPSLLVHADNWRKIGRKARIDIEDGTYLLVYSVERFNNDFIFEQARRIAHARQLKMYVVCSTYPVKAKDYGFDRIFAMADVTTFLRLIDGAAFVVASSFHGTAFALNFNKDFITITPDRFNIRMESLVQLFDVAHRIVTQDFVNPDMLPSIDYAGVNSKLANERKKSLTFLQKALQGNIPF